MFIFFMLFLVGNVSAFEFDNWKSYDEETKTITIENAFGLPLIGDDIAKIQLKTPLDYLVPRGYQKVAEFEVTNFIDYNNTFKELELYDRKKEKFVREYDYKVLSYEDIIVNDYKNEISGYFGNGTAIYKNTLIGNHIEKREKWTDLKIYNFKENDSLTIGIFTEVMEGDEVEWIPNFFGVRIDEWAGWTEGLTAGLVSYYPLNETTGSVIDSLETNVGIANSTTRGVQGKINNSFTFDGVSDFIDVGKMGNLGSTMDTTNLSISLWFNTNSSGTGYLMGMVADTSTGNFQIGFNKNSTELIKTNNLFLSMRGAGGTTLAGGVNTNLSFIGTGWHHAVFIWQGSSALLEVYFDGVSQSVSLSSVNAITDMNNFQYDVTFGARNVRGTVGGFLNVQLDEIGIWNRSLNASEILNILYNEGVGCTYNNLTCIGGGVSLTLNSPVDAFNTTNQTINFNGSAVSTLGVTNVTLFIDGVLNETNSSGINDTDYLFTKITSDGNHNWTYESCNSDGCKTATTRTFTVDSTNPFINITRPLSIVSYHEVNTNLTINWTVSDLNLDVCILEFEGVNRTVTCLDNSTEINITNNINSTVIFYANDTFGNSNSTSKSWNYTIFEHSRSFELSTIGGSTEDFELNVTKDSSLQISTVSLVYNSSASTASFTSGDNPIISKSLDIPNPDSDTNFSLYFSFTLSDSQIINTSSKNQTVLNFGIGNCSVFSVLVYNFTLLDEENQTQLSNVTIDYAFNLFDKSRTTQITNFSLSSTVNPTAICVNQNLTTSTFSLDGILKYISTDSSNYLTRYYNILNFSLMNSSIPNNINLYDVIDTTATPFQLTFRDNFLVLTPNILVNVNKQFVSSNDFKTVEIPITDTNGQTILNLVRNTAVYNLIFIDLSGNIVASFSRINAFCQDFTIGECTLNLDASSTITKTFNLSESTGISYTLEYVNSTSTATFTFNSLNSTAITARIVGTTQNQFGNQTVCDNSLTSTLGTLTCNASSILATDNYLFIDVFSDGNYVATQIININPANPLIGGLFGTNGYFIAFFMLLLIIIFFSEDKQVLLIMLGMGWAAILIFGLIKGAIIGSVSGGIWLLVSIITMIWKLKKEETPG